MGGDKIPDDIANILGPNEQIMLFVKEKIYHPRINVDSVILTNQRIILRHPHAMGLKKDYTDYSYSDIANAILDKGIVRSSVKCVLRFGGDPLQLGDIPNSDAQRAYGIIRENIARFQNPMAMSSYGLIPPPHPAYQQMVRPLPSSQAVSTGSICKKCGNSNVQGARFCNACGQAF